MIDGARNYGHRGFALVTSVVMIFAASLVIAAVVGYVAYAARATRAALARDRCRLVAQSALQQAKLMVQDGFDNYVANNFASVQIAPSKAPAYNWFNAIGADHRTIGSPDPVTLFEGKSYPMKTVFGNHEYELWVGVGKYVEHEYNSAVAIIPLVATAVWRGGGVVESVTVQERIFFGVAQSRVFDNAYFVNNYGWMSGNFTINGDFRANGNVSLKNGSVVNGFIYAAANDYIGAQGSVTISSSSIYNQSTYRSKVSTRARYDVGNLNEVGSYNPATVTGTISRPTYYDGTLKSGSHTDNPIKAIVNEGTEAASGQPNYSTPIEMPFVSDLQAYIDYAVDFEDGRGGRLSYPASTYTDDNGETHGTSAGSFTAHYSGTGPSGDAALADKGSLLLIGTAANPIKIDGPVVVDGDVIIKGYVSGQGTIYSGRNVHIIGDIKYVNEPVWTHSKTGTAAVEEMSANEEKDMLGLVAKGNIVIGDATSSSICDTVSGVSESYECDASDADIGYASTFNGDYSAVEATGTKLKVRTVTSYTYVTETYYDYWGRRQTRTVRQTVKSVENAANRRYYETCCDNNAISDNRSTVSQIDAVMYNNHAVFGTLGANFNVNGALVCRDEGLSANGGSFNWDMRLRRKKNSAVVEKMGLPVGASEPGTLSRNEVPESMNPVKSEAGL